MLKTRHTHHAHPFLDDSLARRIHARELPARPHWPQDFDEAMRTPSVRETIDRMVQNIPAYTRKRIMREKI